MVPRALTVLVDTSVFVLLDTLAHTAIKVRVFYIFIIVYVI